MFRSIATWAVQASCIALVGLCLAAVGCGGNSGTQYSGTITFKGQPVPKGKIYFQPDGAQGNSGQTGYADIVDGKYDTKAEGGMGGPSGAVIVAIEGFGPAPAGFASEGGEEITSVSLFP